MVKRRLPPHIVLPDGRWRFIKRGSKTVSKRKHHKMVKRMARRGRYRGYARKAYGRAGGFKGILAPVVGGFADHYLNNMIPVQGVGSTAVGMFMKNNVVKDIGLYQIGHSLGNLIPIPGFGGHSGGLL